MERSKGVGQRTFMCVLCLSLAIWSVMPSFGHAPTVFETVQDHLEMVEEHGHSHGFEEDLYWAIHGHSHDVADHDHSQVFLLTGSGPHPGPEFSEIWRRVLSANGPSRQFRIERPPRV